MGEYAIRISDGEQIKIGTCESMYYLRYEDRDKVRLESSPYGSYTMDIYKDCFWRLPFPDEDEILPGDYENYSRGQILYNKNSEYFEDKTTADHPGIIQARHDCGLLLNIQCYHGNKSPDGSDDIKVHWNGRACGWFELSSIKNDSNRGIRPIVRCKYCGQLWSYDWADIWDYIPEDLKPRLEKYRKAEKMIA